MEDHESYEEDDIPYLTPGKPCFDVFLKKSHLLPRCYLRIPNKFLSELPDTTVPVVLRYNRKNWNMQYLRDHNHREFDLGWKNFVEDNDLKAGDACVFELTDSVNIRFKVYILRDRPLEESQGSMGTEQKPIEVD